MRFGALILSLAALGFAQTKGDSCTPPPASMGPTLPAKLLPGMGTVHLKITTSSPEAQQFFDQGLAQMHSFWAREAERSFAQAAALDPKAPMPQWGIAMVAAGEWRPRFQLDNDGGAPRSTTVSPAMARARAAAKKAVELSANGTELEKLYVAAIAARRDADAKDPEEAFVTGMRALLAKHPEEVEAKLDLALIIMRGFTLPEKKPKSPGSMEAVEILRGLVAKEPDHPGVHHYIIHGFEGSTFAKDAWASCERYGVLVPNIPHALHMPGHIYSQTARWEDAVKAFGAAAKSEREYMKSDKLYGDGHHGHNVHYMATAYSFEGRYDDAVAAAQELLGFKENPGQASTVDTPRTAYAQGWFAMLRTLVQFEKWDAILAGEMLPVYAKPRQQAWRSYARALAQAAKGNATAAREEAREFETAMADFTKRTSRPEPAELVVARQEIAGHIEAAEGQLDKALKTLEAASKAERKLTYTEPPYFPRPVAEALGHLASRNGKGKVAEKAYAAALEQYPGDAHAKSKTGHDVRASIAK
jgi:tetratricopeptide (TPR) repeat protein